MGNLIIVWYSPGTPLVLPWYSPGTPLVLFWYWVLQKSKGIQYKTHDILVASKFAKLANIQK